jgi:hypothetical protein
MHAPAPILVVGVSRRSGTNFLARLLTLHEDCAPPAPPVLEDHLLRDAPALVEYARRASERWMERWGDREDARRRLERHLGDGLAAFLADGSAARRVVSKTPSPEHLDLAAALMPDASVIVLLRDGRSTVQSLISGFRFSFRKAVDEWAAGAATIVAYRRRITRLECVPRVRFVRYEDLVADTERELRALLEFCNLDPARFDFAAAAAAPVIGSSFQRTDGGHMTWEPLTRDDDFSPTNRFEGWNRARRQRFAWLAGDLQRELGYASDDVQPGAWSLYNRVCDALAPAVRLRDRAAAEFYTRRGARR